MVVDVTFFGKTIPLKNVCPFSFIFDAQSTTLKNKKEAGWPVCWVIMKQRGILLSWRR